MLNFKFSWIIAQCQSAVFMFAWYDNPICTCSIKLERETRENNLGHCLYMSGLAFSYDRTQHFMWIEYVRT